MACGRQTGMAGSRPDKLCVSAAIEIVQEAGADPVDSAVQIQFLSARTTHHLFTQITQTNAAACCSAR